MSAATDPTPAVPTVSVKITISTTSMGANPSVTGISGQCYDSANVAIPGRSFSGIGVSPATTENLQNIVTNCPVTDY